MKKLIIEKNKLTQNIEIIKNIIGNKKIIAVVKFNGYGLGIIEYSKMLIENGINMLAVSSFEEAIELRKEIKNINILMLSSTSIEDEIETLINNDIALTIGSLETGNKIEKISKKLNKKVKAYIKFDTGFGRYGFLENQIEEVVEFEKKVKNIEIEGHFSHFSNSFSNEEYTKMQFDKYCRMISILELNGVNPGIKHICNSSASIKYKNMHLDAVRIGSAFIGRLPFNNNLNLNKIGYIESKVSEIKELPKGHTIGYSNIYKTKRNVKIAIIPAGTIDGINRTSMKDMNRLIDKIRYLVNDIKYLLKDNKNYIEISNKKYEVLGPYGNGQIICDITNSEIKTGDIVKIQVNPINIDGKIEREYR